MSIGLKNELRVGASICIILDVHVGWQSAQNFPLISLIDGALDKWVLVIFFNFFLMYALLTPPPLPGAIIGLVKCPGTVCARLHLKFPLVEEGMSVSY